MAIVSSSFVLDAHAQADGSKYVRESYTDSEGRTFDRIYKLPSGQGSTEAQAKLDAHVVYLDVQLAEGEAVEVVERIATLVLNHQTAGQFAARFWERLKRAYQQGEKLRFARMIWWLYQRVQAGDFTSNEVRLTFNAAYNRSLTLAQWNSFVTSTLQPIRDRYQAMLDQADL